MTLTQQECLAYYVRLHLLETSLRLSPKNYKKKFFVRSKKFLFPVLSGGKYSTPAKFQLDRFITVGGVDGQTYTQTNIPGPYVNYSRIRPNHFIQIGDDFNTKNFWFSTPTQ